MLKVDELISAEVLDEKCSGQLCIIAFLPDIMDSGKDGRNEYIELMVKLGDRFKKQKWGWCWASALAQPELEKALQVGGFGYPVCIICVAQEVYSKLSAYYVSDSLSRSGSFELWKYILLERLAFTSYC